MQKVVSTLKHEWKTFLATVAKSNEKLYYVLLCFYIISQMMYMVGWKREYSETVRLVHLALFTVVMWGSAIYLFSVIAEWRDAWKRTSLLILIGIIVFAVVGITSKLVTVDSYAFIMGIFFCVMACGKKYKKVLYLFLGIFIAILLTGLIGLKIGITFDAVKPNRDYGGHSLGILYPNNWGFLVFAALTIVWYLFLQKKKFLTLALFWAAAVFMFMYITCYTIAGIALLFPIVAIIAELLGDRSKNNGVQNKCIYSIIVALPFLALAIMLLLCWQMDWVYDTFYKYYGTSLRSFAMRFVEGGYALRLNGVTLFGHPFKQFDYSLVVYANEIEMIIDSAFICYLIIRGAIAMLITLGWLSFAHRRCLKEKEYGFIVISVFMLLLSTMERPGLDVWYNYVFLLPLAKLQSEKDNPHKAIAEEI